jgi:tRNA G18 (ribose-2'-O)-methylase SpoU
VEGRQAVRELLAAARRQVREVWMTEGSDPSPILGEIDSLARARHIPVRLVSHRRLESVQGTESPQGVVAFAEPLEAVSLEELVLGDASEVPPRRAPERVAATGPGLASALDDRVEDEDELEDEDEDELDVLLYVELDDDFGGLDGPDAEAGHGGETALEADEAGEGPPEADETDEDALEGVDAGGSGDAAAIDAPDIDAGDIDAGDSDAGDIDGGDIDGGESALEADEAGVAPAGGRGQDPDLHGDDEAVSTKGCFLVLLDGVTDPQNLGAILRSAECAGATGVVIPRHRSAHVTPAVTKAAAGAIEHLPMALVAGIPSALQDLGRLGVTTVGLDERGEADFFDVVMGDRPVALVLGAEGAGLGPLARRRCEVLAKIPLSGEIPSLNVSAAAAVACFEVARQRRR